MIRKLLSKINRSLNNPAFLLKVLSRWAFLSLIVFGFFGIYPQVKILFNGISTFSEMKKINVLLKEKITAVRVESVKVEENQAGITALNSFLPDDYGVQNYVVDLSFATAKTGFVLTGLRVEWPTSYSSGVKAGADLKGTGSFKNLVSTVESLKRISQVNELKFTNQNEEKNTSLLIDIFIPE
jgi:Tfp pilus assembly protein PilO